MTIYPGFLALAINLAVAAVLTLVLRALGAPAGNDVCTKHDFEAEAGEPGVAPLPPTPEAVPVGV